MRQKCSLFALPFQTPWSQNSVPWPLREIRNFIRSTKIFQNAGYNSLWRQFAFLMGGWDQRGLLRTALSTSLFFRIPCRHERADETRVVHFVKQYSFLNLLKCHYVGNFLYCFLFSKPQFLRNNFLWKTRIRADCNWVNLREISRLSVNTVYGKKSFLSRESDTLRSYRVYISPTMQASSALIQIEWV